MKQMYVSLRPLLSIYSVQGQPARAIWWDPLLKKKTTQTNKHKRNTICILVLFTKHFKTISLKISPKIFFFNFYCKQISNVKQSVGYVWCFCSVWRWNTFVQRGKSWAYEHMGTRGHTETHTDTHIDTHTCYRQYCLEYELQDPA